jgi:hypothetical protein
MGTDPLGHLNWPKLLLWLVILGAFRVGLVLISPTKRCPACRPRKGRKTGGPCKRCGGHRRVPRRDARPILRFMHAFVFAPVTAWRHDKIRQAREK